MPVYLPYFLVLTFFVVIYLVSLSYSKVQNQFFKAIIAIIIASFSSVLLANLSLAVVSETIEAGAGSGNQSSYLLPCGQADITATNVFQDSIRILDISISMNGKKAFETSGILNYAGFGLLKLADVHYSFVDFDCFVDVVISTPDKKLIIYGSDGQVSSNW